MASKLKKNLLYNLVYQICVLIIPLITAPYISRVLGVEGIGTYSYVSSVAYYFFIIITLGLNNYGNRSIAKCEKDKISLGKKFYTIFSMQLYLGIMVIAAYFLFIMFIADKEYRIFYFLFLPYILSAVLDINWFYYGLTEFKFTTIRSTIIKILSVLLIFAFVRGEKDLGVYFGIMGGSYLLSNIILWTRINQYVSFYKPKNSEVLSHIKPNLILFVPILAISIYRVMDKIMIKEFSSVIENGYYENADKIITMSMTGFSAVAMVMMPSISKMVSEGDDGKINRMLRDSLQINMFLGIGMAFGLCGIGKRFAPLFFGSDYLESGVLIQLLAVTVVIAGWKAVIRSQYLIPYEKDKAYVVSLVAGAVVNVICNLFFIPLYQARGAVIGTIVAEVTGFFIQTYEVTKKINIMPMIRDFIIFIIPGFAMMEIVKWICNSFNGWWGVIIGIIVGVIVYGGMGVVSLIMFDKKRGAYYLNEYLKRDKVKQ